MDGGSVGRRGQDRQSRLGAQCRGLPEAGSTWDLEARAGSREKLVSLLCC